MAIKIARGTDPFKKYWWIILGLFVIAGSWVCLPLLGGNTGSGSVAGEAGLHPADQSLDAVNNPNGAPGHAVDLSMDGSGSYQKASGPIADSLYQASADPAAKADAAVASAQASGGTLADALNEIAHARSTSGAAGASAAASIPFNPAHASFGSLSGLGGGASGSSASAGFSAAGGVVSLKPFGTGSPQTGIAYTQGLGGGAKVQPGAGGTKAALQAAADVGFSAARSGNLDTAASRVSKSFDGGGGSGGLLAGPGGPGVGINGDTVGDLKPSPNDYSKIFQRTFTPIPPTPPIPAQPSMAQEIMQMLMTMVVGGLVGGVMKAV